jgi:hypothetical protein
MTTEPLSARLERLAKDATAEPWFVSTETHDVHYIRGQPHEQFLPLPVCAVLVEPNKANAALIVELRNAVEAIIAALKEAGK